MKNLPSLTRICVAFAGLLIALAVAGCASVAPLDDASLVEVKLATTDDLARYAQARQILSREEFGGASFGDGKGHVVASFSPTEYDKYLAYLREHPPLKAASEPPSKPKWPTLELTFQSRRLLVDPDTSSTSEVVLYLCSSNNDQGRLWGFGMPTIMWHERFVTPERARQIQKVLKDEARPQTYEIFFDYTYWDSKQPHQRGQPVTILPLPDDLCVALHRWNYPFPSSVGRPLRVGKDVVNNTVGPLPRQVSVSDDKSN